MYVSYVHVLLGYGTVFRLWDLKNATLVKVSSERAKLCAGAEDHVSDSAVPRRIELFVFLLDIPVAFCTECCYITYPACEVIVGLWMLKSQYQQ